MINTNTHSASADRYSVLCISQQNFAVGIKEVLEVIPLPKITKVPNVYPGVYGVFNLRGEIYPIFDLRVLLRLEESEITEKNFLVLLEYDRIKFAVLVDRVLDVTRLDNDKIQVPTRDLSPQYVQYISGYYEHKKLGIIYLLDLKEILQSKELNRYRYA